MPEVVHQNCGQLWGQLPQSRREPLATAVTHDCLKFRQAVKGKKIKPSDNYIGYPQAGKLW
jgi:hypothetical protein